MTEFDWLAIESPSDMLAEMRSRNLLDLSVKLRRWVTAVTRASSVANGYGYGYDSNGIIVADYRLDDFCNLWATPHMLNVRNPPLAMRAAILREVVNPWAQRGIGDQATWAQLVVAGQALPSRKPVTWLTPTVLSLARAAADPVTRPCDGECKGTGGVSDDSGGNVGRVRHCHDCGGSGRVSTGTLDGYWLAVLADALEEEGCGDEILLQHLRGWERCPSYLTNASLRNTHDPKWTRGPHHACAGHVGEGWIPKRSPCVVGCWAVELLNKEKP